MKRAKLILAAEAEERRAGSRIVSTTTPPPLASPAPMSSQPVVVETPTPPASPAESSSQHKRPPRVNMGLYIFRQFIPDETKPDEKYWGLVSDPMPSTQACVKYVMEHGDEFEDAVLMIAQVRKISKVHAEVKRKIKF